MQRRHLLRGLAAGAASLGSCPVSPAQAAWGRYWQPAPAPTPAPAGGGARAGSRPYLVGIRMQQPESPAFHSFMGYYPDYTTNNSFMDPSCSQGESISANNGYPVVVANSHYAPTVGFTAAGAAADSYKSTYLDGINTNIVPRASSVYAFRLSREWGNPDWEWSPYSTAQGGGYTRPIIDPSTWITGFQNYVNMIRSVPALAHVKIAWDYPCMIDAHDAAYPMDYYPGDAYVDIISCDIYFVEDWYGGTSQSCWNFYATWGGYNLGAFSAFASSRGKPIAIWEWADNYGDGYCINKFGQWIKSNNVVAHSYWDESGSYKNAPLQTSAANVSAYTGQFGNTSYAGTAWPSHIPLPSAKPAGF